MRERVLVVVGQLRRVGARGLRRRRSRSRRQDVGPRRSRCVLGAHGLDEVCVAQRRGPCGRERVARGTRLRLWRGLGTMCGCERVGRHVSLGPEEARKKLERSADALARSFSLLFVRSLRARAASWNSKTLCECLGWFGSARMDEREPTRWRGSQTERDEGRGLTGSRLGVVLLPVAEHVVVGAERLGALCALVAAAGVARHDDVEGEATTRRRGSRGGA